MGRQWGIHTSSSTGTKSEVPGDVSTPELIGHSESLTAVRQIAKAVAPRECSVMILGETGTGKEVFARHIHAASLRRSPVHRSGFRCPRRQLV